MSKITQETLPDLLRIEGVNCAGYGNIPKSVMQDSRITPTAKLFYAYLCSFAGAGTTAFPSIPKILSDLGLKDEKSFRKHRNLLEQYDYIRIEQTLSEKNKFGRNVYTLVSAPKPPSVVSPPTVKTPQGKKPSRLKPPSKSNRSLKNNNYYKKNSDAPPPQHQNFEQREYKEDLFKKFSSLNE